MTKVKIFIKRAAAVILCFLLCTCDDSILYSDKDVSPEDIYFDYKISGEEGLNDATIHVRFRAGGPKGKTIVLSDPGKVSFEGEELKLDSNAYTGAYYEIQKRIDSIVGVHSILFTDRNGKEYREEFEFIPFALDPDIADTIKRADLTFQFTGLKPVDKLLVVLTDTAFHTPDINEIETVRNGTLVIRRQRLVNLASGPIYLEFVKEEEKPVTERTKKGGFITLTYGLKRQFELLDNF